MALPETLTREDVEQAIAQLDTGAPHAFGGSTDYDLVFNGKAYPPKAVVGLAASIATGTVFGPSDSVAEKARAKRIPCSGPLGLPSSARTSRIRFRAWPHLVGLRAVHTK